MAAYHFEIRSPFSLSDIHCDFDLPSAEHARLEAGRIADESGHDGETVCVTVRDDGGDTICDVTSRH